MIVSLLFFSFSILIVIEWQKKIGMAIERSEDKVSKKKSSLNIKSFFQNLFIIIFEDRMSSFNQSFHR